MKSSITFVAAAFLCLVAFPSTSVGKNLKFWPKAVQGWPQPSDISRNHMFSSMADTFNYGDSKVWRCTYSNGSAPAISISPFTPYPSTPSSPPPTPKKSPSPPPSLPKTSPPPPTPSPPKTPPPPSLPPHTPNKSPSPSPPSVDPPEHGHPHSVPLFQNRWEHVEGCMRNMGLATMCRVQMEMSFFTRMFRVSDRCCNLIVNMKNECDDVVWGFFTDPFFLPLVRCTCHVSY